MFRKPLLWEVWQRQHANIRVSQLGKKSVVIAKLVYKLSTLLSLFNSYLFSSNLAAPSLGSTLNGMFQ